MAQGVVITNAAGQEMFSTEWGAMVLGGSTLHSGSRKVTKSGTVEYPTSSVFYSDGGIIDFRIEDLNIASNLGETDDTPFTEPIIPFLQGPVPMVVHQIYKPIRSGIVNGRVVSLTANAGNGESAISLDIEGPYYWNSSAMDDQTYCGGGIYRSDRDFAAYDPQLSEAGTLAMAKRNRMIPYLCVGDVFQFNSIATPAPNYARRHEFVSYQGIGAQYTVTSITRTAAQTFRVNFTPAISALPTYSSGGLPRLYVRENLKKVFVHARVQGLVGGLTAAMNLNEFNMWYFRKSRQSDLGTGFGIAAFDASSNMTYSSNTRLLEVSALGVTTQNDVIGITDPMTGDWTTHPYLFGTTPTNYAVYAPFVGHCWHNYLSSGTKGAGIMQPLNTSTGAYGEAHAVPLTARTSPGATTYTICKAGFAIARQGTYPSAPVNQLRVHANRYVLVIDTNKYQP